LKKRRIHKNRRGGTWPLTTLGKKKHHSPAPENRSTVQPPEEKAPTLKKGIGLSKSRRDKSHSRGGKKFIQKKARRKKRTAPWNRNQVREILLIKEYARSIEKKGVN